MRQIKGELLKHVAGDASNIIQANVFTSANLKIDVTHRYEVILIARVIFTPPRLSLGFTHCLYFISFLISVNQHDVGVAFWVSAHFHFLDLRRQEKPGEGGGDGEAR